MRKPKTSAVTRLLEKFGARRGSQARALVLSFSSGIALRALGATFNILAVPILLAALGDKRFAAAAALLGMASWMTIGSAGLGTATAMSVARLGNQEAVDRDELWQSVVTASLGTGTVALIGLGLLWEFLPGRIDRTQIDTLGDLQLGAIYCLVAFSAVSVSGLFEGIYAGLLRTAYCNSVRICAQIITLFILLLIPKSMISTATGVMLLTAAPAITALWFLTMGSLDFPIPKHFKFSLKRSLPSAREGAGYLASSLASIFYCGGCLPLIAASFGSSELSTAAVSTRIIQIYLGVLTIFFVPAGVFLRRSIQTGQVRTAKKFILFLGVLLAVLGSLTSVSFVTFGVNIIQLWTKFSFPSQQGWMLSLSLFIAVVTWSYMWSCVTSATRGSRTAAIAAAVEIAIIALVMITCKTHMRPSWSLFLFSGVMISVSGLYLPFAALSDIRKPKQIR